MIAIALAAALSQAAGAPAEIRPLAASATIRQTLAGGESAVFSIDVPADQAGRIVVRQEGIDVGINLRPKGVPFEHGLDLVSGVEGEERAYALVSPTPATWLVRVAAQLPRAARGDFTISFDTLPADDRARAKAAAYDQLHAASDTGWGGDGPSFQRAKVQYLAAADAALAVGDAGLAAESLYQAARVTDNLGDFLGAIALQRRAFDLFRGAGRRDREGRVLNRLGDLSRKIGEVNEAETFFEGALPLAREVGDPVNIADVLNNSGLLMLSVGRVEEAIEQLQAAVPLAQEVNSANVEGALTLNIADGYAKLGMYDKAIEMYRRGGEIVRRLNIPRRSARSLTALAAAQFEVGNRAAAEEAIASALDYYEKTDDRTGRAETLGLLGQMHYASGELDRAAELFARARPILHEAKSRLNESRVLATWAAMDVDRGRIDDGLAKADEALALGRLIADPEAEQRALYIRARALQKKGRIDDAIGSIAQVVRGVETMRGALKRTELRTSYLTTVRSYFDLYIDLLQQNGSTAAAFETSERARARTLLDGLAESASKIQKGVDRRLLARQRAVQAELNAKEIYRAQIALREGEKSASALAVARDIDRLLEQWQDIRAKIRGASPSYWELQTPEPVTVALVQTALLDDDSALVEYHVGADRGYAWVIDRRSITVHDLPGSAGIDDVARKYHELLSRETDAVPVAEREKIDREIGAVGARLAAIAWKPIDARVRGKRLLIVADGVLQYVPFAALPASTGEPLIVSHEIVYLPSASVLASIRQHSRPLPAKAAAAVFADPVFSKNDTRFGARRDAAAPAKARAADDGLYGRLRFSRDEAEAINAVSPGSFAALDFTAAKQTLAARDLRKYSILHFATHGSLNSAHPELSGLVLSLVDTTGKPVDGFLRLHEIYNLDLEADLVVLSACRTALGKEVHGEGLIGLTRGFMYAGASRVVSSIWNVDDRASAQLMSRFYDAMLTRRLSPAKALREAQIALLRQPRWSNPHYWAAFGLQGEWK
jgi:CHAT domain-containing protein